MKKLIKWSSTSNVKDLVLRSKIIFKIRKFFHNMGIIEVDTPVLSRHAVTDFNTNCFKTNFFDIKNNKKINLWMIPSPEYHMKRLLASGIGSIYQICHSFRNGEHGLYHNPEFTILEWYMINFNMFDLMKKLNIFLCKILNVKDYNFISYRDLFIKILKIDPIKSKKHMLIKKIIELKHFHLVKNLKILSKKILLEILFVIGIENKLKRHKLTFVYHFPSDQALLSSINKKDNRLSDRFEVFFKGIEIANGFHELRDRKIQENRFKQDNNLRSRIGIKKIKLDSFFLNALSSGIPKCSGVAIGIDRLIMLKLNKNNISKVISFSIDNC
ncbi:elongation factor P--(R)-beta-lysine ligase [Buchnera aphidicola (Ceratoglyphina bambusae)]|uniref:elongation factor P--(R)-beta-lysine ligase n=1 Tax=Buchnera aphidicola TaxID=9 RepID=UPI0031B8B051